MGSVQAFITPKIAWKLLSDIMINVYPPSLRDFNDWNTNVNSFEFDSTYLPFSQIELHQSRRRPEAKKKRFIESVQFWGEVDHEV